MILHDGWLLLGGIVALYLYDSALLIYHNELVLISRRNGCRVSGGSTFELGGRHVFLPNPFCPHQPLFRLNWPAQGLFEGSALPLRALRVRVALSVIAPWMLLLLVLFAFGMFCLFFVSINAMAWLAWIVAIYVVIVATLLHVYRYRKALNLSGRAVAAIALDALLCPPFALNIVRKISLKQQVDSDLRTVATSLLSSDALHDLAGILRERIRISCGFLEPDAPVSQALVMYLNDIEGLRK